jgi:hypothetical protein
MSVTATVLVVCASACAPAPRTPDVTVFRWMQAFAAQDGTTMASLTCRAGQSDFQNSRLLTALGITPPVFGGAGGGGQFFGGGGGAGQPTYDVSGLDYATTVADADKARVRVTGPLRISSGMNTQTQHMNGAIGLLREQDQWHVCEPPV